MIWYRWIELKYFAEALHISYERVFHIVYHDLGLRKLSAKWIPRGVNIDQKHVDWQRSDKEISPFSTRLLELFETIYYISVVTTDETGYISMPQKVTSNPNILILLGIFSILYCVANYILCKKILEKRSRKLAKGVLSLKDNAPAVVNLCWWKWFSRF